MIFHLLKFLNLVKQKIVYLLDDNLTQISAVSFWQIFLDNFDCKQKVDLKRKNFNVVCSFLRLSWPTLLIHGYPFFDMEPEKPLLDNFENALAW